MTFALTFDADWAPDYVLEHVFSILKEHGVDATCFLTNPVDIDIPSNIEVGIHPDFRSSSPQGNDYDSIIDQMLKWFPNTQGVRNHRWYWDYSLYELFPSKGIGYDSSLFLPLHPGLLPIKAYGDLVRLPVWLTDNMHLDEGFDLDRVSIPGLDCDGLKIMIFHPTNVFLNLASLGSNKETIDLLDPLANPTREQLESWRNKGVGLETFLHELCSYLTSKGKKTLSLNDIKQEYLDTGHL